MRSGIFDKYGVEVRTGDTICLPYITPIGEVTGEVGEEREVVFCFGCYGYWTETRFVPLLEWMKVEDGEYIANQGNRTVYTGKYLFWIK